MVWLALTLLTMVLFAGFAVDISNWYLQAERIQRAADSGAHAGVIFLPGDLPTATTTARGVVAKNGYPVGGAQNNVVARGFNNAFSGSILMLQDYRFAGVPSLRVNVPFLMTGTNEDVERIEVLLGPASALYGPNPANLKIGRAHV